MNIIESRRSRALAAQPDAVGDRLAEPERTTSAPPILIQVLTVARRRKWIVIASVIGALLMGVVVTLLMTPQFTASTTIEIQREQRNFTLVKGAEDREGAAPQDVEFYQTQYGLLRAQSLAQRVATDLKLHDSPDFFRMFGDSRADTWFEGGRVRPGAPARADRVRAAGDVLLNHFELTAERLSRLVRIEFTSPDPAFSQRVINAWSQHFIQSALERRFEATSYARKFLEQRLAQLRTRIDESERQLVDYAGQQGIVNLPSGTSGEQGGTSPERSLVADDLESLNRELARATADRVSAQSRLGSSGDTVREALDNTAISGMREEKAQRSADYARLMARFEPGYPPAIDLQRQIAQIDRSIAVEESRVRRTLDQTYRSALARETSLRATVEKLKGSLLDLRRRSVQYNIFERDVDTNRQLYDALLQRYKEIGVAGGVGVNNISIVDRAELPKRPSSPRIPLNLAIALLLGLALGGGLALALEQIDQGIIDPAELEKILGVPLLGTVPKLAEGNPLEALRDAKSVLSESYISVQTNLAFSTDHGLPKTLAVTSTRPAEGKTTTSYALAVAVAKLNRRVLLIDGDMRSPSIHNLIGIENQRGLSNYLSGDDDLRASIKPTHHTNLSVITAGPQPPSAAELLSSDRLGALMTHLLESYDHLIFDAPPVMGLADAPLISNRVEGVVFVMEAHGTQRTMAQVALNRLRSANATILGAILTKFDAKRAHYGYGYEYGYGYGYGGEAEGEKGR